MDIQLFFLVITWSITTTCVSSQEEPMQEAKGCKYLVGRGTQSHGDMERIYERQDGEYYNHHQVYKYTGEDEEDNYWIYYVFTDKDGWDWHGWVIGSELGGEQTYSLAVPTYAKYPQGIPDRDIWLEELGFPPQWNISEEFSLRCLGNQSLFLSGSKYQESREGKYEFQQDIVCGDRSVYKFYKTGNYIFFDKWTQEWKVGRNVCSDHEIGLRVEDKAKIPEDIHGDWREKINGDWGYSPGVSIHKYEPPPLLATPAIIGIAVAFGVLVVLLIVLAACKNKICRKLNFKVNPDEDTEPLPDNTSSQTSSAECWGSIEL